MKKKYVMPGGVVIILIPLFYKNIAHLLRLIPNAVPVEITGEKLFYSRLLFWGMAIFLFLYAHLAEKQNLLLKKPARKGIVFYILSMVGIMVAIIVINSIALFTLKSLGYAVNNLGAILKNMLSVMGF